MDVYGGRQSAARKYHQFEGLDHSQSNMTTIITSLLKSRIPPVTIDDVLYMPTVYRHLLRCVDVSLILLSPWHSSKNSRRVVGLLSYRFASGTHAADDQLECYCFTNQFKFGLLPVARVPRMAYRSALRSSGTLGARK